MKLGIILERKIDEENAEQRIIKIETNNNDLERIINKTIYIDEHYKEIDTVTCRKTFNELCNLLDEIIKPYCRVNEEIAFACTANGYTFIYDNKDLINETIKSIFNE